MLRVTADVKQPVSKTMRLNTEQLLKVSRKIRISCSNEKKLAVLFQMNFKQHSNMVKSA